MSRIRRQLFDLSDRVRASPVKAWSVAIGAFLVALYVRFLSDHLLPPGFPYLTFFPAVILTTFLAGLWPGAVTALACGIAAWYWFIPPFRNFELNPSVLVALSFYACVVIVDILLIQVMHKALDNLRDERRKSEALLIEQQRLLAEQRERERQQRILQRELSHRMKNTLAMVQAVVSQSLRNATDTKLAAEHASARIQALARAQDALTAADWEAGDVETVVRTAIAPHNDGHNRFDISGPAVAIAAQPALGLALALHELATNATKYGALSVPEGRVVIRWQMPGENEFRFCWTESGGPAVVKPNRAGFGSRLTERVVPTYFKGKAQNTYAVDGLEYQLTGTLRSADNDREFQ
jgi:two-component sensor histidine kinase